MSIKRTLTTYTLYLSLLLIILGIILTILGVFGVFYSYLAPSFIERILDSIGDWDLWCVMIGPFVLLFGIWYMYDNIKKRREFNDYMATTSKATFIRNQDKIEYLAWKLTPEHQQQLADKKKEFNIKK